MVGFFNKDDEGNYGTAEKDGSANSDNTVKSNEQASGFEQTQDGQASGSMVGIDGLMDKRIKLEESINYVGHMIKTLKDKRSAVRLPEGWYVFGKAILAIALNPLQ